MHGRLKGSIKKRALITIAIYSIMAHTQKHINFIIEFFWLSLEEELVKKPGVSEKI
jgi:hypothetical protein